MPLAQQVLIECKDQYKAFQRMQRLRQIFTKPKEGADKEAQVGHHFQIQVPKILGLLLRSVCTEGEKKQRWNGEDNFTLWHRAICVGCCTGLQGL